MSVGGFSEGGPALVVPFVPFVFSSHIRSNAPFVDDVPMTDVPYVLVIQFTTFMIEQYISTQTSVFT